jgi:hypothetical protein
MTFRNSILAGLTLIREAIRSQNYVAGVAGWSIDADGSAEFADLSIRSSDGSGAVVEIANGVITLTAPSGWKIILDPTLSLPVIYFLDNLDDIMGAINASGTTGQAELISSSGPFPEGAISDWRWLLSLGEKGGGVNALHGCRVRDSQPNDDLGGTIYLDGLTAILGFFDYADSAAATQLWISENLFLADNGRMILSAKPSALPALWVDVVSAGQTGNLLHLEREGSAKLSVDKDGELVALGNVESIASLVADGTDVGRGIKGHSSINGSTATSASTTELVAITLASDTYLAGRAYELHIKMFVSSTVAADQVGVRVHKTNTAGTTYLDVESSGRIATANENYWLECSNVMAVGGSNVTAAMVLSYFRRSGTGNCRLVASATNPAFIEIRDVGLAADYPGATTLA